MNEIKTISFIGSGNVATHFALEFFKLHLSINQVCSSSFNNADILAKEVNAKAIHKISEIKGDDDLYIFAVPDDILDIVLEHFPFKNKLVVHTSGSVNIDVFVKNGFSNFGVFYPLQTFSKEKTIDFNEVPFCLEANSQLNMKFIENLTRQLSNKIYHINSDQRQRLHLAAVFACNFSNNMYQIANDICEQHHINFDILKPLIIETASKIQQHSPLEIQTGPAIRNDQMTIQKHLSLLENQKIYQEIYRLITENIQKNHE